MRPSFSSFVAGLARAAAGIALAGSLAGTARGQMLNSYTVYHLFTVSDAGGQADTQPFSVPGFASTTGQLVSVDLDLALSSISFSAYGENLSADPGIFDVLGHSDFSLQAADGTELMKLSSDLQLHAPVGAFDGTLDFRGASAFNQTALASLQAFASDPLLSRYLDASPNLYLITHTASRVEMPGEGIIAVNSQVVPFLSVTYGFAAIPESGLTTTMIAASILGGTLALRRRPGL